MAIAHQAEIKDALRTIYVRSQKVLDRLLAPYGSSAARYALLAHIASHDGVRSADVIKAFALSPRTVTEAIDALEADGLIQRHADASDRRAKVLKLTAAGAKLYRKLEPVLERYRERLLGSLSTAERKQLGQMLGKLASQIDDLYAEVEKAAEPAAIEPVSSPTDRTTTRRPHSGAFGRL
jgi:DNA-binding MarR family transcriptional regulator